MPEFLNPFSGLVPDRKLGNAELVRALRLDLAAEHKAVHPYLAHGRARPGTASADRRYPIVVSKAR